PPGAGARSLLRPPPAPAVTPRPARGPAGSDAARRRPEPGEAVRPAAVDGDVADAGGHRRPPVVTDDHREPARARDGRARELRAPGRPGPLRCRSRARTPTGAAAAASR